MVSLGVGVLLAQKPGHYAEAVIDGMSHRIVMLLTGTENIRDVIAFPKTQTAHCPLTDAPSSVDARQLRELHIRSTVQPKVAPGTDTAA